MIAILVGLSLFLLIAATRPPSMSTAVARYLGEARPSASSAPRRIPDWTTPWLAGGALVGFLAPLPPALGIPGGAGVGIMVGLGGRRKVTTQRRRRLGFELPAIADLLALYVLAGESVHGALTRLTTEASGVAVAEIRAAVVEIEAGSGLMEAMHRAARTSAHQDGSRLYELIAEAQRSGARLAEALEIFAADRRSSIGRDMTQEGGRRALAGYGPILGLMIPTTLAFLIYPTLAGLDALASAP